MIYGGTLGTAAYGSLTRYGSAVVVPPADADLDQFLPVDARDRFHTVQGRDRYFPVIPDTDPLDVP